MAERQFWVFENFFNSRHGKVEITHKIQTKFPDICIGNTSAALIAAARTQQVVENQMNGGPIPDIVPISNRTIGGAVHTGTVYAALATDHAGPSTKVKDDLDSGHAVGQRAPATNQPAPNQLAPNQPAPALVAPSQPAPVIAAPTQPSTLSTGPGWGNSQAALAQPPPALPALSQAFSAPQGTVQCTQQAPTSTLPTASAQQAPIQPPSAIPLLSQAFAAPQSTSQSFQPAASQGTVAASRNTRAKSTVATSRNTRAKRNVATKFYGFQASAATKPSRAVSAAASTSRANTANTEAVLTTKVASRITSTAPMTEFDEDGFDNTNWADTYSGCMAVARKHREGMARFEVSKGEDITEDNKSFCNRIQPHLKALAELWEERADAIKQKTADESNERHSECAAVNTRDAMDVDGSEAHFSTREDAEDAESAEDATDDEMDVDDDE